MNAVANIARGVVCWGFFILVSGCASLPPRGDSEQHSGFDTFEAAAQAFDKVVAASTTVEQLKALGFDLQSSPNVTLISYSRLTGRFAPDRGVPFEAGGPGIRDCIMARLACRACEFHLVPSCFAVTLASHAPIEWSARLTRWARCSVQVKGRAGCWCVEVELAPERHLERWWCNRSTCNDPNVVSLQALCQQLPRRLIEAVKLSCASMSVKALLAH